MKFKVGDKVKEITMEKTGIIKRTYGLTCVVEFEDDGHWTVDKRLLELIEEEHMTYKEFEEWVEEQGWGCEYDDLIIEVINLNNKLPIGIVGKSTMYKLNTLYSEFTILDGSKKRELYNKMTKLASTPLDKREEVKELTVDEIKELLGYKVKIKGEK